MARSNIAIYRTRDLIEPDMVYFKFDHNPVSNLHWSIMERWRVFRSITEHLFNSAFLHRPFVIPKLRLLKPTFSPFPTLFSTQCKMNLMFSLTFILSSANAFFLDKAIYCLSDKGLSFILSQIHSRQLSKWCCLALQTKPGSLCRGPVFLLHASVCLPPPRPSA